MLGIIRWRELNFKLRGFFHKKYLVNHSSTSEPAMGLLISGMVIPFIQKCIRAQSSEPIVVDRLS